jgi:hypothetical protein
VGRIAATRCRQAQPRSRALGRHGRCAARHQRWARWT